MVHGQLPLAYCLLLLLPGWVCVRMNANELEASLVLPNGLQYYENVSNISACVKLSDSPESQEVTVNITTTNTGNGDSFPNATAIDDYLPVSETFIFGVGTTNLIECIDIEIIHDVIIEDTEVFSIELSSTVHIAAGTSPAPITIRDIPIFVTVEFKPESEYNTTEGSAVILCVELLVPETAPHDIELSATPNHISTTGHDIDGRLHWKIEQDNNQDCWALTALDDGVVENTEIVILSIESIRNDIKVSSVQNATIVINDLNGADITLEMARLTVDERDTGETSLVELCVIVDAAKPPLERDIELQLNSKEGTADTSDFEELINATLIPSMTALGIPFCFNTTIVTGDDNPEANETFTVRVSTVNELDQISGTDTFIITIREDVDEPVVGFEKSEYVVIEGDGPVVVCAEILNPGDIKVPQGAQLSFFVADMTTTGADYIIPDGIEIERNRTMGCSSILAPDDGIVENTEELRLLLVSIDGSADTSGSTIIQITNVNGAQVSVAMETPSVKERNSGESSQVDLCILVSAARGPLERNVELLLNSEADTANANSDFVPLVDTELTVSSATPLGAPVCSSAIVIGDDDQELDETFTVVVSTVNDLDQIIGNDTFTVTILQDGDVDTSFFQILLSGDIQCIEWIEEDQQMKILAAITEELTPRCSCSFALAVSSNNSRLRCPGNSQEVVIIAQLFGIPNEGVFPADLIEYIEQWVNTAQNNTITVGGVVLTIARDCQVEIGGFDTEPCGDSDGGGNDGETSDAGLIAGVVLGSLALFVAVGAVSAAVILLIVKQKKKRLSRNQFLDVSDLNTQPDHDPVVVKNRHPDHEFLDTETGDPDVVENRYSGHEPRQPYPTNRIQVPVKGRKEPSEISNNGPESPDDECNLQGVDIH